MVAMEDTVTPCDLESSLAMAASDDPHALHVYADYLEEMGREEESIMVRQGWRGNDHHVI